MAGSLVWPTQTKSNTLLPGVTTSVDPKAASSSTITGNTTNTGTETSTQRQNQASTTVNNAREVSKVNSVIDNMDPATRQAFTNMLAQLTAGQNKGVNESAAARTQLLNTLQAAIAANNPAQARAMAEGNIAELTRTLMEQTLPGIVGAQESAGGSGSALTQLLAGDAAVRTSEAQQRAILEAQLGLTNAMNSSAATAGDIVSKVDPATAAMMEALSLGKGSMETTNSTSVKDTNSVIQELMQQSIAGTKTSNSTGTTNTTTNNYNQDAAGANNLDNLAAMISVMGRSGFTDLMGAGSNDYLSNMLRTFGVK